MLKWTFSGVLLFTLLYFYHHRTTQLDGHWHVESNNSIFLSLDFEGKEGRINRFRNGDGYFFHHNPWTKELSYFIGCLGHEYFSYEISGDHLQFGEFEAVRIYDCDYEWDFLKELSVDLNLPTIDSVNYLSWQKENRKGMSLSVSIYIGKARWINDEQTSKFFIEPPSGFNSIDPERFKLLQHDDFKISLGNFLLTSPSDLDLYIEKQRIKLPESKRDRMKVRIYADQDTPDQLLKALIAELQPYSFAAIYQVYKPKVQLYNYFHTFDKVIELN